MNRRHLIIVVVLLLVSTIQAQELVRVEYFFDTDPGYGNGIPLAQPSTGENTYEMSFESVTPGFHLLNLRAQDELGRWSTGILRPIFVVNPVKIAAIEYFIDKDPGEGNAVAVPLSDTFSETFAFEVPINELAAGEHTFSVRAKGQDGLWSLLSSKTFAVNIDDTGIKSIKFEGVDNWYNLNGIRIEIPSRGLYIKNGRKSIVK